MSQTPTTVALFVTCLVDLFRPRIGFSAVRLLEEVGCSVEVPALQTCCGQPAYNAGDRSNARALALQTVTAFDGVPYVVVPSGSCAGMIRNHYPQLLSDDPDDQKKAVSLANRTWELTAFLVDVMGCETVTASYSGTVTYQDSCSCLREVSTRQQPRRLLQSVAGLRFEESPDADVCCGFGGTFSVKYAPISVEMVDRKTSALTSGTAEMIVGADLGCLLNIAGRLRRADNPTAVRHIAELLAGDLDGPAIGEGSE